MSDTLILGDSHALCFKPLPYDLITVRGASAQGLTNQNSKYQAFNKCVNALQRINPKKVFLLFGEIDCNATIWHYSKKYNIPTDEQLSRSINNYNIFLINTISKYVRPTDISILTPILPTVPTRDMLTQKSKMRRSILVPQEERTRITHIFNSKLKEICNENGFNFITINDIIIDSTTGLIDSLYCEKNDHHLPKKIALSLWKQRLPI